VCTDLPELRAIPGCTVARDGDEFVAAVSRALAAGGGPDPRRSALVRPESWEAKVEALSAHVLAAEARRAAGPRARAGAATEASPA
jgi:hypothetical protein